MLIAQQGAAAALLIVGVATAAIGGEGILVVVQPDIGSFREVVEMTNGGVVYAPNTAESLADAIRPLLLDRERAAALGRSGYEKVKEGFQLTHLAQRTLAAYASCTR